jgi:RecA/RadA recombinase
VTIIINLYGGPGTGKSTTAAELFAILKKRGENAELAREYVKRWAWEGKAPRGLDQFYLFGKQLKEEYPLLGKVSHVVTDAPMAINAFYARKFGSPAQAHLFLDMLRFYLDECTAQGHEHVHYFVTREKPCNPKGRFQTESEARDIDVEMRDFLGRVGLKVEETTSVALLRTYSDAAMPAEVAA